MLMIGYGQTGKSHEFRAFDRDDTVTIVAADETEVIGGAVDESRYTATMPAGTIRYELWHVDEPEYMVWVADVGIGSPVPVYGEAPQLSLCTLLADVLTGQSFGGYSINAKSDDLMPEYEISDLSDTVLNVDVLPSVEETTFEEQTRHQALEDCHVSIAVEALCMQSSTPYRAMFKALRDMAVYCMTLDLTDAGYHGPTGVSFGDDPLKQLESNIFSGYINLTYQTRTSV